MKMKKHDNNELPRRSFLKQLGGGILATAAVTSGCSGHKAKEGITYGGSTEILGDMTYRIHPKSGDKVSLLGYGCMRWPQKKVKDADGKEKVDLEFRVICLHDGLMVFDDLFYLDCL